MREHAINRRRTVERSARWLGLAGMAACAAAFVFCRWGELRARCGPGREIVLSNGTITCGHPPARWGSFDWTIDRWDHGVTFAGITVRWWGENPAAATRFGDMDYRPRVMWWPVLEPLDAPEPAWFVPRFRLESVEIPLWLPFAACAAPVVWACWRRRSRRGECLGCGYELAGLRAATPCPECGRQRT